MTILPMIDIIIICSYIVGCIAIGMYRSKQIVNIKEYALGASRFPDIVIISTIFATSISASATIGTVEKIYVYGMFFTAARLLAPLFWVVTIKLYGNNIDQFKGCISVSDIMMQLYGKLGRWVTNIASLLVTVGVVACQGAAMGYMLQYFMDISYMNGVYISIAIMVLYSAMGGIRAVAWTDVFQFIIFAAALPIALHFALRDIGGYQMIIEKTPKHLLEIDINKSNISLFIGLVFFSLLPDTGGAFIQRFLIASDKAQLVRALKIVAWASVPFTLLICLIGFVVRVKSPDIEPNVAFIHFIAVYLGAGFKGLVIAGMLAVVMSTADSWINYASVLCAHDIGKNLMPNISSKQEVNLARLSSIIIGVFAVLIASVQDSVMGLIWTITNFWEPVILIPLTAGFLGFRTNLRSFIFSTISGISFTVMGAWFDNWSFETVSLVTGTTGSFIGLFLAHYFQKKMGIDLSIIQPKKHLDLGVHVHSVHGLIK